MILIASDTEISSLLSKKFTEEIKPVLDQVTAIQAAVSNLTGIVETVVSGTDTIIKLANTLKADLDQLIATGSISPADAQALTDSATQIGELSKKLQAVAQSESDANTVDQPAN